MSQEKDFCCHLGEQGKEVPHTDQLFMLAWYPSNPDNYTIVCSDHVVPHLQDAQSTTVYPKGVEW